ncbi:DUF6776 family protein [Shewanella gelidii]|uniref:Uncharacterized protein n=1 Tax=Shewanella gelidii TaxID=1642821 RepID=A0A917N6M3_9GAMM|nr:DUF6776 family protein [Shewanella gelidii]MCL1096705.1 hypothetical protein [Shewanella gelidii]GGI69625.1 hypothetical protein GCM10009332_03400 [Shewanella gelidii]
MSNYYPWWARLQVIERNIRPSSLYLVMLVFVSWLLGALCYNVWFSDGDTREKITNRHIERLQKELSTQSQALASKNLALSVAKQSNKDMKSMFAQQHQQQVELERELAFYRSIMAPEHNAQGVAIHGLEMSAGLLPDSYHIKLVLTQLKKRKGYLKGKVAVTLHGTLDGKPQSIAMSSLTDEKLKFNFRYYQVFESKFELPEGFSLTQVKVKVNVPKSRWAKAAQAEQVFKVSDLLEVEKEQRVLLEQNSQVIDNPDQSMNARGSND